MRNFEKIIVGNVGIESALNNRHTFVAVTA
jgi:hypothetical protein